MRSDNLKKHEMICKKNEDVSPVHSTNNENTIGDILNKVRNRAQDRAVAFSPLPQSKTEVLEIKPKLDLHMAETDSDSEDEDESSEPGSESDLEELKEKFRNLFNQLHHSIGVINELVLVLDELEMHDFLTEEECNALKENIQKRIDEDDIHVR